MGMTHTYQIQYIVTTDPRVYYGHPVVGRSPTIRHGLLQPTCSTFYPFLLSGMILICKTIKSKARTFTMATSTTNRTATNNHSYIMHVPFPHDISHIGCVICCARHCHQLNPLEVTKKAYGALHNRPPNLRTLVARNALHVTGQHAASNRATRRHPTGQHAAISGIPNRLTCQHPVATHRILTRRPHTRHHSSPLNPDRQYLH